MKKKNLLLANTILAIMLVPAWSMAYENQTAPSESVDAPDDLVLDVFDPSFARYVSFDAIADAWADQAPEWLTDCALELAEAERILFRTLRTITADALLEKAIALAIDQQDIETLDRIARYATVTKKDDLLVSVTTAKRLAGAERAIMPALAVNLLTTPMENIRLMKSMIYAIDKARANGNKPYLADFAKILTESTELDSLLGKTVVEALKKYAEDSEKMTAESTVQAKEMESVLDRLSGEERLSKTWLASKASDKQIHDGLLENIPTGALYTALRDYIRQIFSTRSVRVADWRQIRVVAEGAYAHRGDKMQYIKNNIHRLPEQGRMLVQQVFSDTEVQ